MAKSKTRFLCEECGHDEPKWLGHCPSCGSWNTFKEFRVQPKSSSGGSSKAVIPTKAIPLSEVEPSQKSRIKTGLEEFDRVLGAGVMSSSSVLVGGEPGIGKSTLLLQLACRIGEQEKVLYISGEESAQQIKLRGERLNLDLSGVMLLCEFRLEQILHVCNEEKPGVVIIDSIQTLLSEKAGEVPGTVSQLKLCTSELIESSRSSGSTLFFVAHVTKEGTIAGPRSVEHMVDTVLYFEHSSEDLRCLRAQKNRFGSTHELGLFLMGEKGLEEVSDPSALFTRDRTTDPPAGTVTAALYEGSRILLVEIQALTVPAKGNISRIFSERVEHNRISRISAVLEKHLGLKFSDQDIYVNVAGGLKISETAADLPIALALYSARTGLPLKGHCLAMGELSLAGEVRQVPHQERRIKQASDQGFKEFILPGKGKEGIQTIKDAVKAAFQKPKSPGN